MEIALSVLSILTLLFCLAYYNSQKQLSVVKQALMKVVLESPQNNNEDLDVHKENFIKFLSDSREWAYDYIENVQGGLKKFIQEVEPQLQHYNKYGAAVEGMMPPHDFALKKITKEFEELKKLLPEEENSGR